MSALSTDKMPNSTYVYRIPTEVTDPEGFVNLEKEKQQEWLKLQKQQQQLQQQQQQQQQQQEQQLQEQQKQQQQKQQEEDQNEPLEVNTSAEASSASATPAVAEAQAPAAPSCALMGDLPPYVGADVKSDEVAALVPRPPDHWPVNDMLPTYFTYQAKKPRNWNGEPQKPPADGYPTLYGMFFDPKPPPPPKRVAALDNDLQSQSQGTPTPTPMDTDATAAASNEAKEGELKEEKKEEKKEDKKEEKAEEKKAIEKYPTVVFVYAGPQIQLVTKGSSPSGYFLLLV